MGGCGTESNRRLYIYVSESFITYIDKQSSEDFFYLNLELNLKVIQEKILTIWYSPATFLYLSLNDNHNQIVNEPKR